MDQSKKNQQPPKGFNKLVILASKSLKSKSQWADKDEFLDAVYWIRQIIGFIFGVIWGVLSFKGMFGILAFCLINAVIIYIFSVTFQQIDEEEYGGIWEVIKEGFMTSFSTFLVSWIVVYSSFHAN